VSCMYFIEPDSICGGNSGRLIGPCRGGGLAGGSDGGRRVCNEDRRRSPHGLARSRVHHECSSPASSRAQSSHGSHREAKRTQRLPSDRSLSHASWSFDSPYRRPGLDPRQSSILWCHSFTQITHVFLNRPSLPSPSRGSRSETGRALPSSRRPHNLSRKAEERGGHVNKPALNPELLFISGTVGKYGSKQGSMRRLSCWSGEAAVSD
jgi:hypothetical protein